MRVFRKTFERYFFDTKPSESFKPGFIDEIRSHSREKEENDFDGVFKNLAKFTPDAFLAAIVLKLQSQDHIGISNPVDKLYCVIFRRNALDFFFLEAFEHLKVVRGGHLIVESSA